MPEDQTQNGGLPRENLIRATFPANLELRDDSETGMPVMDVQFARYNEWTEIRSSFEGNFMERLASKAFVKTITENVSKMRVLFQHGRDPQIGDKVLGSIRELKDTETGPRAKVPLYDTSYNRDLVPGLKDGAYGASFRFQVMREEVVQEPDKSDYNPKGLPERTITEAKVMEFGPVTFPAYEGASAGIRTGVRALTLDDLAPVLDKYPDSDEEKAKQIKAVVEAGVTPAEAVEAVTTEEVSTIATAEETAPPHPPEKVRRDTQSDVRQHESEKEIGMASIDEMQVRRDDIRKELEDLAAENLGQRFDAGTQARWDELQNEHTDLVERIAAENERRDYLASIALKEAHQEHGSDRSDTGTYLTARKGKDSLPENVYALSEYHNRANSQEQLMRLYSDGARRAVDGFSYPHPESETARINEHVERLLRHDNVNKEIAMRVLVTGSPTYRAAFFKQMMGKPLSREEQAALSAAEMIEARDLTTAQTGGVTVPIQIDPTVIPTSNGVLNPFRQLARNVTTTSYIWQGVTSPGVTAQYRAEAAVMTDGTPTLVPRPIQPERADVFIPFSWEAGADWGSLESQLAEAIQDSKDALEATKFAVGAGHGSNEPQGLLVGAGTVVGTSGATALGVSDIYALEAALPPRYQANAAWMATPALFSKVRQFVAASGPAQWADSLIPGNPPTLLGYPAYKASTVGTAGAGLATTARWGVLGDFSRYVIVDRVGLSIRVIPDLFGGTAAVHYPTGQSGLVAYWRNSAGVIDSNAFRVGTIT